jgi:penicillin-insensitive murein DD-endopeptidase
MVLPCHDPLVAGASIASLLFLPLLALSARASCIVNHYPNHTGCPRAIYRDNRSRRAAREFVETRSMRIAVVAALVVLGAGVAVAQTNRPAKQLFGSVPVPAEMAPRAIGSYAKGCLAGAVALPLDGPNWQVMRLSRNRNWGHPVLIDYIKKLSADAARDGWPGLLVGDLAQPRGGPMLTGHASHQIGLDGDIWLIPMPDYQLSVEEREKKSAVSMLMTGRLAVDQSKWTDLQPRVLKRAASYPEVARIFVSAAIKQQLCQTAGSDRAWLRKIRPWYGHDAHFHVRLECPPGGRLHPAAAGRAGRRLRRTRRMVQAAAPAAARAGQAASRTFRRRR